MAIRRIISDKKLQVILSLKKYRRILRKEMYIGFYGKFIVQDYIMELFLIIGLFTIIFLLIIRYLLYDLNKQKISIEGRNSRRESTFSCTEYSKDLVKDVDWKKQLNQGPDPKKYKKEIEYKDHFIDCEGLLPRKGL